MHDLMKLAALGSAWFDSITILSSEKHSSSSHSLELNGPVSESEICKREYRGNLTHTIRITYMVLQKSQVQVTNGDLQ